MPVLKLNQAQQAIDENKYGFSPLRDNETTGGKKLYFRDYSSGSGGSCPRVMIETPMRMPFELSAGKGKEVTPDATCNLELSLNEQEHPAVVQYFKSFDGSYKSHVAENAQDIFRRRVSDAEIGFMHVGSLNPDKKVQGRYLLRLKVSRRNTTVYVVTSQDGNNINRYRQGSMADLRPGCSIIPVVEHVMGWTGASQFGAVHGGKKLLVFPYTRPGESDNDQEDEFPFGAGYVPDQQAETAGDIQEGASPTKRSRTEESSTDNGDTAYPASQAADTGELSELDEE